MLRMSIHYRYDSPGFLLYSAPMGKKVKIVVDVTERGRAGGHATAANRTPTERSEAARAAVKARWEAYYRANPDKLKARKPRKRAAKKK